MTYYYKQVEGEQLSVAVAIVDSYFNNIYLVNATEIQLTVESMLSARGISLEQKSVISLHVDVDVDVSWDFSFFFSPALFCSFMVVL